MAVEINFMVGGEAGQGVQSVGFLLGKVFSRGGYHVFADQDYESRVRGGHNFFRVRVKDSEVNAIAEPVDMLLAMNKESIDLHQKEVVKKGAILYDGDKIKDVGEDDVLFSVPLEKLAEEKAGNKIMANTVLLGAALGLVDFDLSIVNKVLLEHFGTGEMGENNIKAAKAGYDFAKDNYKGKFSRKIRLLDGAKMMFLNGNEALAMGAIAAGCKFMAAYPMTPTTSIMEYFASKAKEYGLVMVQPEDEIAAINMAVGAGYAGVRAMTATSGSGFCLMVEGLGMAGITETPVVVVEGQRAGPAVGLPTRTEQGDLEFMIYAHHGEFPRAVLTPATIEECFWAAVKAFNLADKYQLPVIIMTDQYLASSYGTVKKFDISKVTVDRGLIYKSLNGSAEEYKRHKVTPTGISPRAFPGQEGVLVVTDVDEHDEAGHLTEDAQIRTEQVQKRLRKMFGLKNEIAPPKMYGPKKAGTTLVGWGSTYGAIREAVDILRKNKADINYLHLSEVWPFPAEQVADILGKTKHSYVIENNATGQLAHLISAETGKKVSGKILKFDGRPFTPEAIIRKMDEEECVYGHTGEANCSN